jgi:sec-independent protein translocase protein TatC
MVARALRKGPAAGQTKPSPDSMTLFEHLAELRRRIIVSIVAFLAGSVVCYIVYDHLLTFLRSPYCKALHHQSCFFVITAPLQGFSARLDLSALGGLIIALPIIIWELWQFVTPGLKANEKRYALPFVLATVVLFAAGATTAYEIFPRGLGFLIHSSGTGVHPFISIQSYVSLISLLILIFGLAFEFPVVLVGLELAGAVTPAGLRRFRRFAILIIVIVAAVFTPSADPFSMFALALPLYIFYEGSILVGRLFGK